MVTLKATVTLPIIPGIVKIEYVREIDLPRPRRSRQFRIGLPLAQFALDCVLADQFAGGHEQGGWSKSYDGYIHFLFGDTLPPDVSTKDTITFSASIAEDLVRFLRLPLATPLAAGVLHRLDHLGAYIVRHQDAVTGGFGRLGHERSRGGPLVQVDLRHTLWALIAVDAIASEDPAAEVLILRAAEYIRRAVDDLHPVKERAYTFAALHRFLTTESLAAAVWPSIVRREQLLRDVESALIAKYSGDHNTWDADRDPAVRTAIDNALYTLRSVRFGKTNDAVLRDRLRVCVEKLANRSTIASGDQAALPFHPAGGPDLGATVRFVQLLCEEGEYCDCVGGRISKYVAYINDARNLRAAEFCFPWHLSGALAVAGGPSVS